MIGILFVVGAINLLFLQIRRLHDFDYRGWWLLLGGIPLLGQLLTLAIFSSLGQLALIDLGTHHLNPL